MKNYEETVATIKKETSWSLLLEGIIDELIENDNTNQALEYTSFKAFRLRELLQEKLGEELE